MKMQYPETIDMAEIKIFSYNDMFKENEQEQVRCYYQIFYEVFGMHKHSRFYEISVILEGECMHYIENHCCRAEKGCVFVIPPGIYHGYYPNKRVKIFNILIAEDFFERYRREINSFEGFDLLFEIEPSLRGELDIDLFLKLNEKDLKNAMRDFARLKSYENGSYSGKQSVKNAKALEILGVFCEKICERKSPEATKKSDEYVLTIIESMKYIREHISDNISSRMLSKKYNMSESTFIRHFLRVCSQTPYEYITNTRIKTAKLLLRDTKKTVSAIGKECGFYDGAHFVRCFERAEGINPAKYREKF